MAALHSITFDPKSGRPIPPIWWKVVPFFTAWAWLMAAIMMFLVNIAIRENRTDWIAGPTIAVIGILLFTYWERRRVLRAKRHFIGLVAKYEVSLLRED